MLYSFIFSTATLFFGLARAAPIGSLVNTDLAITPLVAVPVDVDVLDLDRRTIVVPALSVPSVLDDLKTKSDTVLPQLRTS